MKNFFDQSMRWLSAPLEVSWANMRHFSLTNTQLFVNGTHVVIKQEVALPQVRQELGDTTMFWLDTPEQQWLMKARQQLEDHAGWQEAVFRQAYKVHSNDPIEAAHGMNASYLSPGLKSAQLYTVNTTVDGKQHVHSVNHWENWMRQNQLNTTEVHIACVNNLVSVVIRYSWLKETQSAQVTQSCAKSPSETTTLDLLLDDSSATFLYDSLAAEDGESLLRSELST